LWCSRRLSRASISMLWYVQHHLNVSRHFALTTPDRWMKAIERLDQATHLAAALVVFATVCVTYDDRLFFPSQGAAVPICHPSTRSLPYTTELGPRLSPVPAMHRILHSTTLLTFAEPPTDIACNSYTSLCIKTSSSAHRRSAVLTCKSFIPNQETLRSLSRSNQHY